MRAVRCVDGRPTVVELAAPAGDGVRIKTASAGVCGSDLHMLELGMLGPYTVGHEFAGWLEDGRPVAVEPLHGCGDCDLCRAGDYNRCPANLADIAGISRDGGMADEVLMWPEAVVPLPTGVDARDACLVEPIAMRAVRCVDGRPTVVELAAPAGAVHGFLEDRHRGARVP